MNCKTGKIRYDNKGRAVNQMRKVRSSRKRAFREARVDGTRIRHSVRRREARAYYCSECGGFHLTSSKNNRS